MLAIEHGLPLPVDGAKPRLDRSKRLVEAARIRVSLPAGLSFWSEGRELAQRDFEWTQPLSTGDNEIPIAVRGQRPGRYRIGVETRIGNERIEDEIMIEVTGG